MRKNILIVLALIYFISCNPVPRDVRDALEEAGENQAELQKVIDHYSKDPADSLKLKAAYFLIKHMPGHYTNGGENAEKFAKVYRAIGQIPIINPKRPENRKELYDSYIDSLNIRFDFEKQYDIHHIKAKYVIDNIDKAFEAWQTAPWGENYNFDIFCEYVLPYSISHEMRTSWRELIRQNYGTLHDKIKYHAGKRFEAEKAFFKNGEVEKSISASNRRILRTAADKNTAIVFKEINCGFAGDKTIYIRYYNGGDDAEQKLTINGKFAQNVKFSGTGRWTKKAINDVKIQAFLKAGKNELRFESTKNAVAIDFVEVRASEDYQDHFNILSGGVYKIENKHAQQWLTVKNGGQENRSKFVVDQYSDQPYQKFRLLYSDYGFYSIHPIHIKEFSKAIDVIGLSKGNGAEIALWNDTYKNNQKWAVLPVGDFFKIVNKHSGKCLEYKQTPGGESKIVQHEFNGNDRQLWSIELLNKIPVNDHELLRHSTTEASFRTYDLHKTFEWFLMKGSLPEVNARDLITLKTGNCREETQFLTYLSRGLGIPIAIDQVPQWGDRAKGHYWNVIFNGGEKPVRYYFRNKPGEKTKFDDFKKPKIFRFTQRFRL